MSVEIEPISPKTDLEVSWGDSYIRPVEIFYNSLGPSLEQETGWNFSSGDPEFWKFRDRLVVPGGKALDIGIGFGRTSLPLALQGMNVVGIDNEPVSLGAMRGMTDAFPFLSIELRDQDIVSGEIEESEYDTVILGQTLTHLASVKDAYQVLDKAIKAVKPGGHIWIRAGGTQSDAYQELMSMADQGFEGVRKTGERSFSHPDHHFGFGEENVVFFEQTELMQYLAQKGLKIVHSQIDPDEGKMNIMFGEDWKRGRIWKGGMITLIGQKPQEVE